MNIISSNTLKLSVLSITVAGVVGSLIGGCTPPDPHPPLISSPSTAASSGLLDFYGSPATAAPLATHSAPQNPFLAEGRNGIHEDTYNSDVSNSGKINSAYAPPLGHSFSIDSHKMNLLAQSCPTLLFDAQGRIITVCIGFGGSFLYLLDPDTLAILAKRSVPPKQNISLNGENDSSGGGYLHLNNLGQVIVNQTDHKIVTYEVVGNFWQIVGAPLDVSSAMQVDEYLQDGVPDYQGRVWFTGGKGTIGYIDPQSLAITVYTDANGDSLNLQNQIAMDATGIYVVTHGAMNKLIVDGNGDIVLDWSTPYENTGPGVLAPGSGTSPTLFGTNDDLVAIADNDDAADGDGWHLNVYNRTTGVEICSIETFAGEGGSENSPIGYDNTIVIENNSGFAGLFGSPLATQNGLVRVDVNSNLSGCTEVWRNMDLKASTTPQLSTANGLIYSYTVKAGSNGNIAYYMSTIDFADGTTVFEKYIGSGSQFTDMLQPVTIGPDGAYYAGTKNGLLVVRGD